MWFEATVQENVAPFYGLVVTYHLTDQTQRLGEFLIFLHLVHLHAYLKKPHFIQPCLVMDRSSDESGISLFETLFQIVDFSCPVRPLVILKTVEDLYSYSKGAWTWPPINEEGQIAQMRFNSTYQQQAYFRKYNRFPSFKIKPEWRRRANCFLEDIRTKVERPIVALHLKQQIGQDGKSNANVTRWIEFINDISSFSPCFFVLVGKDGLGFDLSDMNHIAFTRDAKLPLPVELAILQETDFFMGMSSGLCQMAIFGDKPYAIFKNPGHDTKEMECEHIINHRFPFASEEQHFLIAWEDNSLLRREFMRMTAAIGCSEKQS
ncbi:MAG: hypothetical protein HYS08_03190 [Chlamydiae bacterium]|nr:hypothetical protein [Chlamydiota bacterium]